MKKEIKIWLEPEELKRLKQKSLDAGFVGKGSLSHYLGKIANESICFISPGVRVVLEATR